MDTEGHLLAVVVHEADVGDREGARWVLRAVGRRWPELQKLWADQGYTGDLTAWLRERYGIDLEIVERGPDHVGFVVLPRRWGVERSSAWYGRARRLSKDYEHLAEYSESGICSASIHFLLKRLAPSRDVEPPYARKAA